MKILVTGSNGFIGKHMCLSLMRNGYEVLPFDIDKNDDDLVKYIAEADFTVGLDVQRHAMSEVFACDIVPVLIHAVANLIEHGPNTQITYAGCTEIDGCIGG